MKIYEAQATEYNGEQEYFQSVNGGAKVSHLAGG